MTDTSTPSSIDNFVISENIKQEVKQNFTFNNIAALIFVTYIILCFILPTYVKSETVSSVLALGILPIGAMVAISFFTRIIKLTNHIKVIRVLGFFIGLGGAGFLFLLTIVSGLAGSFGTGTHSFSGS